ncbi:hypothetical protein [Stappia sp. 28M-7]|uniref:hypothetical protein n=1 Tax=Stappia sp. 28M-7 TaxID=2762596 RepID=UPI00163CE129|nr:hypothetical protein [Stappia sp. 28M-7]MBC2861863.1 hypothetical protein [Stappia sp. 28M-7]
MQQAERQPPPDAPRMGEAGLGDGTGPGAGWRTAFREGSAGAWIVLVTCSAATCGPLFLLLVLAFDGVTWGQAFRGGFLDLALQYFAVATPLAMIGLLGVVPGALCGFPVWLPAYAGLRRLVSRRRAAILAAIPSVGIAAFAAQQILWNGSWRRWEQGDMDIFGNHVAVMGLLSAVAAASGALHASWIWRNRA